MKVDITDGRERRIVKEFQKLQPQDVFEYNGVFYSKLHKNDMIYSYVIGGYLNAYCLSDGTLKSIPPDANVTLVYATLFVVSLKEDC